MLSIIHDIDDSNSVELITKEGRSCHDNARFDLIFSSNWGKVRCSFEDLGKCIFIYVIGSKYGILDKFFKRKPKSYIIDTDMPERTYMEIRDTDARIIDTENGICIDLDKNIMMQVLVDYTEMMLGFNAIVPIHHVLTNADIPTDILTHIKKLLAIEIVDVLYNMSNM